MRLRYLWLLLFAPLAHSQVYYSSGTACSSSSSALTWATNTGFACNTSINAATLGGAATFAAPGPIGSGTPSTGAFTTSTSTSAQTYNSMAAQYTALGWGVPMIIPSSGTIGNNGALSAITTLGHTYASCYMFFPANAIVAGSAAGFYYVVMSSATAGTIKNNTYTSGIPAIPGSPTAFSTTGPGAYTQSTAAQTLISLTVPGGLPGPNGALIFEAQAARVSGTNALHLTMAYGGSTVGDLAQASIQWYGMRRRLQNLGLVNANNVFATGTLTTPNDLAAVNAGSSLLAVDTSSSQTFTITGTLITAASDWIVLFGGTVSSQYAP